MANDIFGDDTARSLLTAAGEKALELAGIDKPKQQESLSKLQKDKEAAAKRNKEADQIIKTVRGEKPLSIKDTAWIKQVMFIPQTINYKSNARAAHISRNREFTPGMLGFADTTLGGNRSINPRPQFTEFADQNVDSILSCVTANTAVSGLPQSNILHGGMGRYYSEAIDNPAQRIYMTFGVPRFNSLGNFFTRYYDNDHAKLANQGIINKAMFYTGKALTWVFAWYILIPLKMIQMTQDTIRFLARNPPSKYYFVEPTMHTYWMSVNSILSDLMVNMGLLPDFDPANYANEDKIKSALNAEKNKTPTEMKGSLTKEQLQSFRNLVPDIYLDDTGTINAIEVATRYQKLANAHRKELQNIIDKLKNKSAGSHEEPTPEALYNEVKTYLKDKKKGIMQPMPKKTMEEYIRGKIDENDISVQDEASTWKEVNTHDLSTVNDDGTLNPAYADDLKRSQAKEDDDKLKAKEEKDLTNEDKERLKAIEATEKANAAASVRDANNQADQENANDGGVDNTNFFSKFLEKFGPTFGAAIDDGMQFVSFVVDYDSNVSESISSSTRTSTIAEAMNSASSASRNVIFNMAGGNIGDNPVAGMIETVAGGVKNLMQGVANTVGLQGFAQLGGAAFVDIPDFWESTEASISDASYTIQLRSPYGNTQSLLQNIYFPLAMLLAGALPRSTGKNSYTGPLMCQLWHKGRNQISTGIITQMNISRGTGNVAWNLRDQAVGIDVTFTVKNLSKVLHMPIKNETGLKDIAGLSLFQEESNWTNYLAILAGLGLYEQYYHIPNLMRQFYMSMHRWDQTYNSGVLASAIVNDTTAGYVMQWFGREAEF